MHKYQTEIETTMSPSQQAGSTKRYCLPCAYNKYQNQIALLIKLEFTFHFIHIHVSMHTQSRQCRHPG